MSEATWIYQPGFPAESGSAFMINERLFSPEPPAVYRCLLNADMGPGRNTEPQGHAKTECWLVGDIELLLWKQIVYRKLNPLSCKFV